MSAMLSRQNLFMWIAGAAIVIQMLSFGLLHVLEPALGVKSSLITDYVATEHSSLARAALVFFGITWVALSLGLRGTLPPGILATAFTMVMFLAGLGLVYSATLDAQAIDPRLSEGPVVVQRALGLLRVGLFISLIVVSLQLRGTAGFGSLAPALIGLSGLIFVLLILSLAVLLPRNVAGIGQRAVFVLTYAWVLLVTWGSLGSTG